MSNNLEVFQSAQLIRNWCKVNLPFYESVVGYDLVIFLAISFLSGESITVKRIFDTLPYSYTAVRQHYLRLIKDGWITSVKSDNDKRVKRIVPTPKFNKVINEYAKIIVSNTPPALLTKFLLYTHFCSQ